MKKLFWIVAFSIFVTTAYFIWPETKLPAGTVVDKLIVHKSKRKMMAYSDAKLVKTYNISLGFNPVGHKQQEGDGRTPEGTYVINDRNPNSGYHKNLSVSYPNDADKAVAKKRKVSPGGDIKIHGLPNNQPDFGKFHRMNDWTFGCIAVTNEEIDELYIAVKKNAVIEILP
ncbi:MAG: L,D-transpeptidase family protein [Flavobacterium sp.]